MRFPPCSLFLGTNMNSALMDAAPQKVQLNKKIYDWAELEAAINSKARLEKETPLSLAVLERALTYAGHARVAQLEERVVAVAQLHCIDLWYGHTSPGSGLETLVMMRSVKVFPAQGGRTTYEINMGVNGYFANRHLPMRAKDRGGKSMYRNTKWYCGQSGIYQPGIGPMYPDIGPAMMNLSHDDIVSRIRDASFVSQEWRDKAESFVERVKAAVAPFGDAVLRYEHAGLIDDPEDGIHPFYISTWICGYEQEIHSKYGVTIRVKHPARATSSGWEHRQDMALAIAGPAAGWQDADDATYVVSMLHGGNARVPTRDTWKCGDNNSAVPYCVYRKPSSVIDLARRWCGDNIYIPA